MDSWRDTASEEAQEALDDLFEAALELAEMQVAKQGGFNPFAVTVTAEGVASVEMTYEEPDISRIFDVLWDGLRAQRDEVAAVAVVADVRIDEDGWTDGIRVEAEHREGIALEIVAPYRRRRLRRSVELGEFGLSEGQRRVW
ncbi:hypothetical protein GCM10029976_019540 [Kribbella albertanoniae]|uniref:Uncharacterized protein n=1 Tax=Kribbella albertanoniae TaxID=1266829 RepID=A0A4R4PHR4_9ACTN|nr:hypothetical protein [Kribbella albertanoniae]TDC21383.1 hypothetical protein E1261_33415 [Kribbella albertanoniae]